MKAASPVKNKRIKRNSQQRFDSEISEKLIIFDRLFKKYNKTRLHVDKKSLTLKLVSRFFHRDTNLVLNLFHVWSKKIL